MVGSFPIRPVPGVGVGNILVGDGIGNHRSIISVGHDQLAGIISIIVGIKSRAIGGGYVIELQMNFRWNQMDFGCCANRNLIVIQFTIREIATSRNNFIGIPFRIHIFGMLIIILKGVCSIHLDGNLIFQSSLLRFSIIAIGKASDLIRRICIILHTLSIAIGLREVFCIDRQSCLLDMDVATAGNDIVASRFCAQLIRQITMIDDSTCRKPFAGIGTCISCSTVPLARIIFTIRLDFIENLT